MEATRPAVCMIGSYREGHLICSVTVCVVDSYGEGRRICSVADDMGFTYFLLRLAEGCWDFVRLHRLPKSNHLMSRFLNYKYVECFSAVTRLRTA